MGRLAVPLPAEGGEAAGVLQTQEAAQTGEEEVLQEGEGVPPVEGAAPPRADPPVGVVAWPAPE